MDDNRQQYTTETLTIPNEGIQVEANCVDITFLNVGTALLIVQDNISLSQGQFVAFTGNKGEIDKTKYRCRFTGGGTRSAVVARRNYK